MTPNKDNNLHPKINNVNSNRDQTSSQTWL